MKKNDRHYFVKTLLTITCLVLTSMIFGNQQRVYAQNNEQAEAEKARQSIENLRAGIPVLNSPVSSNWGNGWKEKYGLEDNKWVAQNVPSGREVIYSWQYRYLNQNYIGKLYSMGYSNMNLYSISYAIRPVEKDADYTFLYDKGTNETTKAKTIYGPDDALLNSEYFTGNPPKDNGNTVYVQRTKEGHLAVQTRGTGEIYRTTAPMRNTYIPAAAGGVKNYIEMQNGGNMVENAGYVLTLDTMLNDKDRIPIYNYKPGQGMYMNNETDGYKILMTKSKEDEGPFDNYLGHRYWECGPFIGGLNGSTGHEINANKDQLLFSNGDSAVSFKWNVTPMPPNSIRQMGLDFDLKSYTPPIFTLDQKGRTYQQYEDDMLPLSGKWRDKDSTQAQLYMRAYPRGSNSTTIEQAEWVRMNQENEYFENENYNTDKAWNIDLAVSTIGEPSDTPYQVDFKMRDYPGEDFSKETHSLTVKIVRDVKVETSYLDEETGLPIEIDGTPVASTVETVEYGSRYQTTPKNLEPTYYYKGRKTADSDPESGMITTIKDRKVKYLYEKGKITLKIRHLIDNNPQKVLKEETKFLGYRVPYKIEALLDTETISQDVVWDDVVPHNSEGITGSVPQVINITFNYVKGTVKMVEATPTVNFGNNLFIQAIPSKKYISENQLKLKVKDQRKDKSAKWRIGAKVLQDLKPTTGGESIAGAFQFASKEAGEDDIVLEENVLVEVYKQEEATVGQQPTETEISWDGTQKEGLFILTQPGQIKKGSYSGKIEWVIVNGL